MMPSRSHFGKRLVISVLTVVTVVTCAEVSAQRFGGRGGWNTEQNIPSDTGVILARWRFGHNGWFGGFGWAHNYPSADQNLGQFIDEATAVDVENNSYRWIELASDEIFDYPFAMISEPGEMRLSEQEVINFREYINRGGFVLMDDFDGVDQLGNMRQQIRRVFPDRDWVPLEIDHLIFSVHFELDDLHAMDDYVPGGYVTYYAMFNDEGEIVMIAGHNNDLMNFWDWFDEPGTPLGPATDAFRLAVNYMIYALTH